VEQNTESVIFVQIVYDFVKKMGQNFEMSRYVRRKYRQKSKKPSPLDSSSHRKESREMPLTPAERTKTYKERKRMRAFDQPSTSAAAFALNPDDEN